MKNIIRFNDFEQAMEYFQNILNNHREETLDEEFMTSFIPDHDWMEELVSTVDLEDELANIKANIVIDNGLLYIGGQLVEFKKNKGKSTISPYLGEIEIKGKLKVKIIKLILRSGIKPRKVKIFNKPYYKFNFQYGIQSIDLFLESINKPIGFFKRRLTSKINNQIKHYTTEYWEVEVDPVRGNAFPEIEDQMLEQAKQLREELEQLARKSQAVRAWIIEEDIVL